MRSVLFAAALLIGTAAYAQDTGGTQGGMQAPGAAAGGSTVAPSNEAPKRDARGVPVISAPATAPAGWNNPPGTPGSAPASATPAPEGSAGPLPPCSRKVTDNCVQTYERHHGGDTAAAGAGSSGGMTSGGDTAAAGGTDTAATTGTDVGNGKTTTHHRRRHRRR